MRFGVAVLISFLCLVSPVLADPDAGYRLDLVVDLKRGAVEGKGVLKVRNTGEAVVERLPLVLYPARFRTLDQAITDVNFDRFYARWFDDGDMSLQSVRQGQTELVVTPADSSGLPPGTAMWVALAEPLAPGEWVEMELAYRIDVPDRLGSFGFRDGRVVLDGGLAPYVPLTPREGEGRWGAPPTPARYDLGVTLRGGGEESGALIGSTELAGARVIYEGPSPFLAAGDGLVRLRPKAAVGARVYGSKGDEDRAKVLAKLANDLQAFFQREFLVGRETPLTPLTLVEAPLRDRFADVSDQVVLYSDRLLHIFVLLRQFHELEFSRAVLLALTRQVLRDVPLGADRDWVAEGVAWMATQAWVQKRHKGLDGTQVRRGVELLSFIPLFDDLLKNPRFPGSDLFYGRFYEPADAVPDGFTRALARRQRGRVAFEKLRELVGDEACQTLVGEILAGTTSDVPARAGALADRDLSAFFSLWLGPLPRQNLSFGEIKEDGQDLLVEIVREGDERLGAVGEPVDVEFQEGDEPVRVRWPGFGMRGQVRIPSGAGYWFPSLEIDPERRTNQWTFADDTTPRVPVKILVNRFSIRIDLNQGNRNEGAIGVTLHPAHNYAHAVTVDTFYEEDEHGVSLRYGYGFGAQLDARTFGAGLGVGATAARLDEGVLESDETSGDLVTVRAGGSFDTRITTANPTWGFRIGGGVEYTDRFFGTDFRFRLYSGSAAFSYSLIRGTQVAAQVRIGQIDGALIPSQRLFDAGGEGTVRGVPASTFVDTALVAVRGEFRQMIAEDLDVPLLWLSWLRKVQAVAFLDAGDVGPTIDHILQKDKLWKWGAGGGVRLFVDAFGVKNVVVRFDVATRVFDFDEGETASPQFYLGVNQSF